MKPTHCGKHPPSPPLTPAGFFPMTTQQTAIIIRECIRDAAKEVGCKPSDAHDPPTANRAGIAARNLAIVSAHRQGVSKDQLCEAFRRSWETVNNVLLQDARNAELRNRQ